jgi:hypothetical protein
MQPRINKAGLALAVALITSLLFGGSFAQIAAASGPIFEPGVAVQTSADGHTAPGGGLWDYKTNPTQKKLTTSSFVGSGYYYGDAQQVLSGGSYTKGLSANVYIASPYVQCSASNPSEHSIMELAIADSLGNTVEMGWYRDCASSSGPMNATRLFITYWNNGVWCGAYVGGAGTSCPLYVDNGSNPVNAGSSLASYASATYPANIKAMSFYYTTGACGAASAGWFFYFDSVNVGCVPPTAFTGGFSTATVSHAFGEVYYGGSNVPCTDMGNGVDPSLATGASGPSAFFSVGYISPNPAGTTPNLTLSSTDTNAYSAVSLGSTGNRSFKVSGKGYNSTGGLPGNTGSC